VTSLNILRARWSGLQRKPGPAVNFAFTARARAVPAVVRSPYVHARKHVRPRLITGSSAEEARDAQHAERGPHLPRTPIVSGTWA
jgi:hypothetical protein